MKQLMIAMAVLFLFAGCDKKDTGVDSTPPPTATTLLVLNSLGKSLSAIDLDADSVYNNIATLGSAPNQVVYHSGRIYVVNSLSNSIQVFGSDYQAVGTVYLGAGSNPWNLAFLNDTKAYVTCLQSDSVKVINIATLSVTGGVHVGVGPEGVAIANGKVFVTNSGFNVLDYSYSPGTLSVIDPVADTVLTTITVEKNPQALALAPNGMLHVACTGDYATVRGKIVVVNPVTHAVVKTIDVGGNPGAIAIAPDLTAYVGISFPSGVIIYDAQTYAIADTATNPLLHRGGSAVACDESGRVCVADFDNDQVIIRKGSAVAKAYTVGDGPQSLAFR